MTTVQERAGLCAQCERQVLVRRQRGFGGWSAWHCAQCGTATAPLPEPIRRGRLVLWISVASIVFLVVVMLMNMPH